MGSLLGLNKIMQVRLSTEPGIFQELKVSYRQVQKWEEQLFRCQGGTTNILCSTGAPGHIPGTAQLKIIFKTFNAQYIAHGRNSLVCPCQTLCSEAGEREEELKNGKELASGLGKAQVENKAVSCPL